MNRKYLLDSLDGLKAIIFRLLPAEITQSVACVPMTTDGPWTDAEKAVFEATIGIPNERTYWTPGGFVNVPRSNDPVARSKWVNAVADINHRYLFLDPDTGFYKHHNSKSEKKLLITELAAMLGSREVLIVYRHQYWPRLDEVPAHAYPYVWHGLSMLRNAGFITFAYQSQAASVFFISKQESLLAPFQKGFQDAFAGVSAAVIERRLIG